MKENIVERKIMWGDLDSLGIVFYPRYYEWIDACGHLFFESISLNIGDLWRDRKIIFGLVETSSRYFKPGRYHQEIRIITTIDALKKKTVLLKHIIRGSRNDELLVEGSEKRICLDVYDPENFQVIEIPPDIFSLLKKAKEG
jgi:YbgC/YbaW family acyl-CoA thioester hydrolase